MREQKYIFSGSITDEMVSFLLKAPQFIKMNVLVSQLDRSGVQKMLAYMERGVVASLFIDSGAYSVHSQGITIDVDEYIDYVNSLDDKIVAAAQVDHIPGKFRQPKSPKDYEESAKLSWENFLYMYPKMKSPEKLIAVMHQGESFDHLGMMLDWRDSKGNPLPYIGISPSNDRSVSEKDMYLAEIYDYIKHSSNPDVKTHLFGYTSLPGLTKFPWYSADSVSHRLRAAYCKVFTRKWNVVSLSRKREVSAKTDMMFLEVCDQDTYKEFKELVEGYGMTLDDVVEKSAARTALDILEIQAFLRENPYHSANLKKQKKLFKI